MDTGLIFPDRRVSDGGTEHIYSGALLDWRPCSKMRMLGKSGIHKHRESGVRPASAGGITVKSLPRKTSKLTVRTTVPQTDTGDQLE